SHADRHPLKRPLVTGGFALIGAGIIVLTYLGYKDTPEHHDPSQWTPLAIAGREIAQHEKCVTCHRAGGAANPIAETRMQRAPEWVIAPVQGPPGGAAGVRAHSPG